LGNFYAKAVTLAFQGCKFRSLKGCLFPGWLVRHDLAAPAAQT